MRLQSNRLRALLFIVAGTISVLLAILAVVVLPQSSSTPTPTGLPTEVATSTLLSTEPAASTSSTLGLPLPNEGLTVKSLDALQTISLSNADRLSEVGRVGRGAARDVAWSPDGRWLAVASSAGVYFYNPNTFEPVGYLNSGATKAIAFSPADNNLIAVLSERGKLAVWDLSSASETHVLAGNHSKFSLSAPSLFPHPLAAILSFSPDGKWLTANLTGDSVENKVSVWEVSSGQKLRSFSGSNGLFMPDQSLLVWDEDQFRIWDVASGRELRTFAGPPPNGEFAATGLYVQDWGLSPDGTLLSVIWRWISGLHATNARQIILNLQTGEARPIDALDQVVFAPEGTLLSGGALWDAASGQRVRPLGNDEGGFGSAAFSPDGKWLATSRVDIWEVNSGEKIRTLDIHLGLDNIAFASGEQPALVAVTHGCCEVDLWDLVTGETVRRFVADDLRGFVGVALDDTQVVLLDSYGCKVWVGDIATGTVSKRGEVSDEMCANILLPSPSGDYRVINGYNDAGKEEISLWNVGQGEKIKLLEADQNSHADYYSLSPNGDLLAVVVQDAELKSTVTVYAIADGRTVLTLTGFTATIDRLVFSPGNSWLALHEYELASDGPSKGMITVWNIKTGEKVMTISDLGWSNDFVFSLDDTLLAVAGGAPGSGAPVMAYSVTLWEVVGGQKLTTLPGTGYGFPSYDFGFLSSHLSFVADGKLLITREDDTLRLWGVPQP